MRTRTIDVRITVRDEVPLHVALHDVYRNTNHILSIVQLDTKTTPASEIDSTRVES